VIVWIFICTPVPQVHRYGFGNAMDSQVSTELIAVFAGGFDARAAESEFRELLHIKKVGTPQVVVPFFYFRIDGSRVYRKCKSGITEIGLCRADGGIKLLEE